MNLSTVFDSEITIVLNIFQDFFMISFCFFSLIILVYYIRRRYHLYLEMKTITAEQLWFLSFQNHLKNLRIKAMIANFVMIILLVEMGSVLNLVFTDRCRILTLFKMENNCSDSFILSFVEKDILSCITAQIYIPILCLFVKVLWLTYLHSPYKYCFIKWVVYMIVKILAVQIVGSSTQYSRTINSVLNCNLFSKVNLYHCYLLYSTGFYGT